MNKRTLPITFVAVALALAVLANGGLAAEGARNTPTPTAAAPSALPPEGPTVDEPKGDVLTWEDRSNNEDGFRIDLRVCGESFHYQVPANTTSFKYPSEYLKARAACTECDPDRIPDGYLWSVAAYNRYGEASGAASAWGPCGPPPRGPRNVVLSGSTLKWVEGPRYEAGMPAAGATDGFEIDLGLCSQSYKYDLPAGTTSFELPAETEPYLSCLHCGCSSLTVTASNRVGESSPSPATDERGGIIGGCKDCVPLLADTATPFIVMPRTGVDGRGGGAWGWQWALLAGGVGSLGAGVALFARSRMPGKLVQ